jgi:hypothetical protein
MPPRPYTGICRARDIVPFADNSSIPQSAALGAADRPRLAAFVRVAEARLQQLKDTPMNVARGDLSGVVGRSRASRRPFVTTAGWPKVTWSVAEAS